MVRMILVLLYFISIIVFVPYVYGEQSSIPLEKNPLYKDNTYSTQEVKAESSNSQSINYNNTNSPINYKNDSAFTSFPISSSGPSTTSSTRAYTIEEKQHFQTTLVPSIPTITTEPLNSSTTSVPILDSIENINKNLSEEITPSSSLLVHISDNIGSRLDHLATLQSFTEQLVSLSEDFVSRLIPSSNNTVTNSKDSTPYNVVLVQGYNEFGKKSQPLVTQPKETMVNGFGIKKIYPTKPGGEEWYMNIKDINDDPRFEMNGGVEKMVKNSDGSWSPFPNDKVRLAVYTSNSIDKFDEQDMTTYNLKELSSIGHWYKENDWLNIEMTGYFKLNSADDMATGYSLFSRAIDHSDLNNGCGGATPKFNFGFDGELKAKKKMLHGSLVNSKGMKDEDLSKSFKGKWLGIKAIIYNLPNGDVRQEFWLDKKNNGQFEKVYQFTDNGEFGIKGNGGPEKCGGQWDQKYTWGSPKAIFRWDQADVSFKDLSIREIIPPTK